MINVPLWSALIVVFVAGAFLGCIVGFVVCSQRKGNESKEMSTRLKDQANAIVDLSKHIQRIIRPPR